MSTWGVRIYRMAAKVMGIALHGHEIVESVYANRGVGRGEVAFGRSDIDLSIIVRNPKPNSYDGPELYSLYRRAAALRRINPALTHMMVHDTPGIIRWMQTDSYFGSQERRSMILLAGRRVPTPDVPVQREDAVRYVALWIDRFFPLAVQQHNKRNLRKTTIEIWKAWAVAKNYMEEPCLTLREAELKAPTYPDGTELHEAVQSSQHAVEYVLKLAGLLHAELLPPLRKLQEPLVIPMPLPPRSQKRILVILPNPATPLPAAAFEEQSFIATPELLHLYVHYLNPFLDWTLPPELRRLGFLTPNIGEFARACRFFAQDNILRFPGFIRADTWLPGAIIAFNHHSIPHLQNGEIPPPMSEEKVRALLEYNPTYSEYYRNDFGLLYERLLEQSDTLSLLAKSFALPPI
jgi:hypothetical protein